MSDSQFPNRTAGDVPLPNGDVVFVCTLNTMLREEADQKARWYATAENRDLMKGESGYAELLAQVKAMSAEDQSMFLADQSAWTIRQQAEERYPVPEKPEQGDAPPDEFTKIVAKWESDCKEAEEARKSKREELYNAQVAAHRKLKARDRVEKCCIAYHAQQWAAAFVKRLGIETLYRATRLADDHTLRYFKSAAAFEDALVRLAQGFRKG